MHRALVGAALLCAAALAGCVGPFALKPFDVGPTIRFGQASVSSHDERASYDALTQRASVEMRGTVTAHDADHVRVDLWLVDAPCPTGPSGQPRSWLSHEVVELGNVTSGSYDATLDARLLPGAPYSAMWIAQPAGLGPAFPGCSTLVAAPAAPANLDAPDVASLVR